MSNFKVGTEVAIYYHGSFGGGTLRKGKVAKVRKDLKFHLFENEAEGKVSATMWTPGKHDHNRASQSGSTMSWRRNHVEVWTKEHDLEIKIKQDSKTRHIRIDLINEALDKLHYNDPSIDSLLDAIENTGLMAVKEEESK